MSKINTEFSYVFKRVELKHVGEKFFGCFRVRPIYILFLIPWVYPALEFGNVTGVAAVICLFDVIPLRVIDRFIDTLENSVYVLVVVRSSEVWDWSVWVVSEVPIGSGWHVTDERGATLRLVVPEKNQVCHFRFVFWRFDQIVTHTTLPPKVNDEPRTRSFRLGLQCTEASYLKNT